MALGLSLILGSWGAGSSASAEGPASSFTGAVFYGYVLTDDQGALAERIRAVAPTGAVCGTAEVIRMSEAVGYYALSVASSEQKHGCPSAGGVVQFALLAGRLDDGAWAGEVEMLAESAAPQALNLQPAVRVTGNWLGASGDIKRDSWLRWAGPSVSLGDALASLPLPSSEVYYLDPALGQFVPVTPSTDIVLASGDLVLVRFR